MREDLPTVAAAGMAEIRSSGTWGSSLTSGEFAAIRSAGFEPVGQVFGAAVYAAGAASGSWCPAAGGSSGGAVPGPPSAQVPGRGSPGFFGPLVEAMYQARHTAIKRMATECAGLGGHGVVGVRLARGPFPLGGLEFTAIGTAVRAPGAAYGRREPFTCDLSGQDFAKLIMTGWVPAGLALGISVGSRHDDRITARQARWGSGNAEVVGWTELVNESRHDARRQLESEVRRLGAEGVVIAAMQLRVSQRDCPVAVGRRDHVVETTLTGTAIARFSPASRPHAGPALAVMALDRSWSAPLLSIPGKAPMERSERVRLAETTCYPRPTSPIPVIVGGGGEKHTLAIAARLGDGCHLPSDISTLDRELAIFGQHCLQARHMAPRAGKLYALAEIAEVGPGL